MPIQYAGGTNINYSFTQSMSAPTRREIVDGVVQAMTDAGWSTISGAGTGDVMLESATTPASQSLLMRARIYDPGSGTCARVKIQNAAGTRVQTGDFFLASAASRSWRVIANQYQVFILAPGLTLANTFLAFGVPFLPTFLEGVITECIWGWGASNSDADTIMRQCPRISLGMWQSFVTPQFFVSLDTTTWEINNSNVSNTNIGLPSFLVPVQANFTAMGASSPSCHRWQDDNPMLAEALLMFGSGVNSEAKIRGQLWDAIISTDVIAGDRTFSLDSKSFYSITHNNYGGSQATPRGTLLVRVP